MRLTSTWIAALVVPLILSAGCTAGDSAEGTPHDEASSTPLEVPAGTTMTAELLGELDSREMDGSVAIQARLSQPITVDGAAIIPVGATVRGSATRTERDDATIVTLRFEEIHLPQEGSRGIDARPIELVARPDAGANALKILGGGAAGAPRGPDRRW